MYSIIHSGALNGIQSYIADVEVDTGSGLPGFDMVGKLSGEVKEARERVRVSLNNSGISLPPVQITVNISPAGIQKSGTAFDLPIAIGILTSLNIITSDKLDETLIIGELGLDGQVRRVNGVLPIIMSARSSGFTQCIVPAENAREAGYVKGISILPTTCLLETCEILRGNFVVSSDKQTTTDIFSNTEEKSGDFAEIIGQEACKRAALIAASGFHHLLISGPPGAGKTMIARRLPGIMPPLSEEESLSVSTIYSVSGLLSEEMPYITERPFQNPHHTSTKQALTGGGIYAHPGIISLSHKGVLFLDEFPEFSKECIEVLREPLEDKKIQISRVNSTFTYPADFMLVAAANPCPCGYYPNRNLCNCTESMIARYRSKISGPMKDRIDIIVRAEAISADQLINASLSPDQLINTSLSADQLINTSLSAAASNQYKTVQHTDTLCLSSITSKIIPVDNSLNSSSVSGADITADNSLDSSAVSGADFTADNSLNSSAISGADFTADNSLNSSAISGADICGVNVPNSSVFTSTKMREEVLKARLIQQRRYAGTKLSYNSDIAPGDIEKYCPLGTEERDFMHDVYTSMNLSARSYHKILKVARTIADLDESDNIKIPHLSEAICYRG